MFESEWKIISKDLLKDISKAHFLTYFKNTSIISVENNVINVGLPREFFLKWHENNSKDLILLSAKNIWSEVRCVSFVVDISLENKSCFDPRKIFPDSNINTCNTPKIRKLPKKSEVKISYSGEEFVSKMVSSTYTLDNFIVGGNNSLAHAVSKVVAENPGKKYNPLFIYGDVGLGKTHLLQGIANYVKNNNCNSVVLYYQTQNFVDEVVEAVRSGKSDKIRSKFKKADVLLLDDIQFLAGKERTQEILFHIFNDLFDANKQIVISADKCPAMLNGLTERLVSRFSMGMVVDIQMPDKETKLAILQKKMHENEVIFNPKVLDFVAENSNSSIRELLGTFKQMVANYELQGVLPNLTNTIEILKKTNRDIRDSYAECKNVAKVVSSIDDLSTIVADFYDITVDKMKSSLRTREYTLPRQVAMYFANKKLRMPLKNIGNFFGGRDHTSVLSAVRKIERDKKISTDFWREVNVIKKKLGF